MNVTIASFQELSDSTAKLFDDFQQETTGLEQDIRKQVGDLHEFHPQMQKIESLEKRMRTSKARAEALGSRLDTMRNEVDRWDKREIEWQKRTNQRLRIFWGIVTASILAVLVAILLQHWPSDESTPGFRTLPKALKMSNFTTSGPTPMKDGASTETSENEKARSSGLSAFAYIDSPSTTQADGHISLGADDAVRFADRDPLQIFDEL